MAKIDEVWVLLVNIWLHILKPTIKDTNEIEFLITGLYGYLLNKEMCQSTSTEEIKIWKITQMLRIFLYKLINMLTF